MMKETDIKYIDAYISPLGKIFLTADENALTGLYFEDQKFFSELKTDECENKSTAAIFAAKKWLDIYFSDEIPNIAVPIRFCGTPFRCKVWNILSEIPYGKTITYGEIASRIAESQGINKMSSRAVGGAISHNPISIIIPCHRVIGKNGKLTGYAAGVNRKAALLALEATGSICNRQ